MSFENEQDKYSSMLGFQELDPRSTKIMKVLNMNAVRQTNITHTLVTEPEKAKRQQDSLFNEINDTF